MLAITLSILVLVPCGRPAHPDVVQRFHEKTAVLGEASNRYRLFVPQDAAIVSQQTGASERDAATKRFPLVVWFHGRGESGDDNTSQLGYLEWILGEATSQRDPGCFILAAQCGADEMTWLRSLPTGDDPLRRVDYFLQETMDAYSIDPDRIYAAGVSDGASACWEFARRYPDRVAAMLPMGTCELPRPIPTRLRAVPVWMFQSHGDGPLTIAHIESLCQDVRNRGGRWAITAIQRPDHDCWSAALQQYSAWEWLLAQRRGSTNACPPGKTLTCWRIERALLVTTPLVVATCLLAILCSMRRNRMPVARHGTNADVHASKGGPGGATPLDR